MNPYGELWILIWCRVWWCVVWPPDLHFSKSSVSNTRKPNNHIVTHNTRKLILTSSQTIPESSQLHVTSTPDQKAQCHVIKHNTHMYITHSQKQLSPTLITSSSLMRANLRWVRAHKSILPLPARWRSICSRISVQMYLCSARVQWWRTSLFLFPTLVCYTYNVHTVDIGTRGGLNNCMNIYFLFNVQQDITIILGVQIISEDSDNWSSDKWLSVNMLEWKYVTHWAKTRHIAHFMKIEIRPEIGIPMCNCAAGKKWKRSVAWFPSYRAKCVADAERNFSRKRNGFMLLQ